MTDETVTLTRGECATTDERPLVVPRKLGPVRLLHEIGHGGMGVVWRGRHDLLGRDVAVKFLLNATDEADPAFAGFLEGAQAAAAVRHAGLNAVHHADVINGSPYLVMEYVDGPTLAALVRGEPLSLPGALTAIATIADAVAALHAEQLIHRDIKPSNVLLDQRAQLFVSDFGLACSRRDAGTLRVVGTPQYMAPEMFDGAASPRTDVYALGITAFELLNGRPPFAGDLSTLMHRHRTEPLPIDALRMHGVPASVLDLLDRATHKNPIYRFKTATHFLRALRDAAEQIAGALGGQRELELRVTRAAAVEGGRDAPTEQLDSPAQTLAELVAQRAEAKRRGRSGSDSAIDAGKLPEVDPRAHVRPPAAPESSAAGESETSAHTGSRPHTAASEAAPPTESVAAYLLRRVKRRAGRIRRWTALQTNMDGRTCDLVSRWLPTFRALTAPQQRRFIHRELIDGGIGQWAAGGAVLVLVILAIACSMAPVGWVQFLGGFFGVMLLLGWWFYVPIARVLALWLFRRRFQTKLTPLAAKNGSLFCSSCGYPIEVPQGDRCSECGAFLPLEKFAVHLAVDDREQSRTLVVDVIWPEDSYAVSIAMRHAADLELQARSVISIEPAARAMDEIRFGAISHRFGDGAGTPPVN